MRTFFFYKEPSGRWFIDLPEWKENKDELEMILGADTMLNIIAQEENKISLIISLEPFENCDVLEKIENTPGIGGAFYKMKFYKGIEYNLTLWLCEVTRFIFGKIPNSIYIK